MFEIWIYISFLEYSRTEKYYYGYAEEWHSNGIQMRQYKL